MFARAVPLAFFLLLSLLGGRSAALAAALCAVPGAEAAFVGHGAQVRSWPGGEAVFTAPAGAGTVWSLACDGTQLVVGLAGDDGRGRLVLLARGEGGWTATGEIPLRGVPIGVAVAGGRIAVEVQERKRTLLGFAEAGGDRPDLRELPGTPRALAVSPDGETFLLALGNQLKTYRVSDGGTWLVYELDREVTALAARSGVPRLLVARPGSAETVDLRDTAVRGALPLRETAQLGSLALWAGWADAGGRIAALLLEAGPELVFLAGDDLRTIDRAPLPEIPAALAALDRGRVLWLDARGEVRVAEPSAAALAGVREPHFQKLAAPPEADVEPEPIAAAVVTLPAAPSAPRPEAAPSPVPSPRPPPPPAEAPAQPAEPASAPIPPPSRDPSPASEVPPSPPPDPAPAPPPAPVPPPPPSPAPTIEQTPPAGTIAGVLRGEVALVAEIVVAGPDNITAIAARRAPDRGTFRASGLAPGTYRVTPMGPKGATLRSSPAFATVTLGADQGARADFEIAGGL